MAAPFYQIKMVVKDVYIEYTTSDKGAMYDFLGNPFSEENIKQEEEIPTAIEHLTKFLRREKV